MGPTVFVASLWRLSFLSPYRDEIIEESSFHIILGGGIVGVGASLIVERNLRCICRSLRGQQIAGPSADGIAYLLRHEGEISSLLAFDSSRQTAHSCARASVRSETVT